MKQKLPAELWDKMHYLFRSYNDRMVHVELDYDHEIDVQAFKTVVICFLEKIPVLHSRFVDNKVRPYWEVEPYKIEDIVSVHHVDGDELEQTKNDFLTQCLPPDGKVQMKIALFIYDGKTDLCIIENHMCMDGGDFKYFLKSLCSNYNNYVQNGQIPLDIKEGSRSYKDVYKDLGENEKEIAKNLYKNIGEKDPHGFPFSEAKKTDYSFIYKHKIGSEKLGLIKSCGKAHDATINDMLVAAYFYSIYELAEFPESDSVSISCAIDLRRHLENAEETGLTNHTAWMQCLIPERGRDIFETLRYVVQSSNKFKQDEFIGLYGLPLLSTAFKIVPNAVSEDLIKIGYNNPLLAMSNIGILEEDKLAFDGHKPIDGFMSGAVKYKPFALLSATTLNKEITLSMCVRGNDEDKKILKKFFALIDKNIDALIAQ
ncbi:MAG: condensation domain-containing protein [Ruminococcus sp.]|nr:condensation domain-containing protein [Ruminococcus sp.]